MANYVEMANRVQYDKESGVMLWNFDPSKPKTWNTRFAGKQVGVSDTKGRTTVDSNGCKIFTRRLAYFIVTGQLPEIVETINGNPLDDSFLNLKEGCDFSVAQKHSRRRDNLSGECGVYKRADGYGYSVNITHNKNRIFKTFKSKSAAESYAREKRLELGFNDLHGRG